METSAQESPTTPPESGVGEGETISAHDELDLSDAGFSVPRTNWQITEATVESPQPGQQRAVVEFTASVEGIEYQVTERYWLQYTGSGDPDKDERVTQIGRGQLKRLFNAALGTPAGSVASLEGEWVSAEGDEDDQGFRRIRRIREAEAEPSDTGGL